MSVLIVDDDVNLQVLLTTFLEDAGYTVHTAATGADALRHVRQAAELPDVLLLDIAMPVMTGWGFLREQHHDPRLAAIPVILMTALGWFDHEDTPPAVVAALPKPLDLAELEALLAVFVQPPLQMRAIGA